MGPWLLLLGGMIVWAAHFLVLYILASIFGSTMNARVGVALFTIAGIAADVALLRACRQAIRHRGSDHLARWIGVLGAILTGFSLVAIIWQSLPALLG